MWLSSEIFFLSYFPNILKNISFPYLNLHYFHRISTFWYLWTLAPLSSPGVATRWCVLQFQLSSQHCLPLWLFLFDCITVGRIVIRIIPIINYHLIWMLIEQMVKSEFGLQLPGYQLDNSVSRLIGKIIWI